MTDILIVGAGPAGLTAAIYAARAGMSVKVFERNVQGGQVALTDMVDNFPSRRKMSGVEFATDLYTHATELGAELLYEAATGLDLGGGVKTVTTSAGAHQGRSLIFAGGAVRRKLGVPGEDEFIGRGVSFCATCDAAFFRDKTVAIVGGGNTALGDALFLSNHCKKVYLIHRRAEFRAEKSLQDAVAARGNIEKVTPATVKAINGDEVVRRVVLDTPEGARTLPVDGIFVAVGLLPDTALLKGAIPLDESGYTLAGEDCTTPIPGVFVAGDIRKKPLRQIVTAAADGAVAAVAAAEYVNALDEDLPAFGLSKPVTGY